jgi:hypothetical protein
MKIFFKNKKLILLLLLFISIIFLVVSISIINIWKTRKCTDINIYFSPVNPLIKTITADSSNRLVLRIEVRDNYGKPVSGVFLEFNSYNDIGIFIRKLLGLMNLEKLSSHIYRLILLTLKQRMP